MLDFFTNTFKIITSSVQSPAWLIFVVSFTVIVVVEHIPIVKGWKLTRWLLTAAIILAVLWLIFFGIGKGGEGPKGGSTDGGQAPSVTGKTDITPVSVPTYLLTIAIQSEPYFIKIVDDAQTFDVNGGEPRQKDTFYDNLRRRLEMIRKSDGTYDITISGDGGNGFREQIEKCVREKLGSNIKFIQVEKNDDEKQQ